MFTPRLRRLPVAALSTALLAVLLLTGCDTFQSDDPDAFATAEVGDLYASVSDELDLSAEQQRRLARALGPHDHADRTPGYLWIVADSLSRTLTDEQKAVLLDRTGDLERGRPFRGLLGIPGAGGYSGFGGLRGGSSRHGHSPLDEVLDLTGEQEDAIAALHEAWRDEVKAIRDDLRSDAVTEDEALRRLMALHESRKAEIDALLTDEQRAALATFRTERETAFEAFRAEVTAVRDDVLGLTSEESETMNALFVDHLDAREVLLEQFQSGALSLGELETEIALLHAALEDALDALLTDAQFEVVQIHNALVVRIGKRGHRGRHGPPGEAGR